MQLSAEAALDSFPSMETKNTHTNNNLNLFIVKKMKAECVGSLSFQINKRYSVVQINTCRDIPGDFPETSQHSFVHAYKFVWSAYYMPDEFGGALVNGK